MELWIRSQDKLKLYKMNTIETDSEIESCKETGRYIIYINDDYFATYKTKERALEVLDEIQKILKPQVILKSNKITEQQLNDYSREILVQPMIEDIQIKECSTYVYEMPEK